MIRVLLAIFISLLGLATMPAQEAEEVYRSANDDFADGKFEQASLKYRGLAETGHVSAELFYNLGTSLFREGKPGPAMLWMRRAQVVHPGMPEALQSVAFLRRHLAFLEFADNQADRFVRMLPPTTGRWIFTVAAWLALIAFALAYLLPRFRPNRFALTALGVLFLLLSSSGAVLSGYRARRLAVENFATVIAPDSSARTAPAPGAKSVIDLPEGSEVRILQHTGNWYYTEIPGNLRGWIRAENLEPVWPIPNTDS